MFNEPEKEFLYASYKLYSENSDGKKIIEGTATGFVIEIGETPWIITNRHVIDINYKDNFGKYKDFKLSKLTITGRRPDDTEYSFQLHDDAEIHFHDESENDLVMIQAKVISTTEKLAFHYHFSLNSVANSDIYKNLNPFDLICYSGFPSTHDKLNNRPILRSGNICSDPKFNYSWNEKFQGQIIAYEGFSTNGASGSPIFAPSRGMNNIPNSRHGYLIGINAGHISETNGHSGISYFYKSTLIHEIIKKYNLNKIEKK